MRSRSAWQQHKTIADADVGDCRKMGWMSGVCLGAESITT